MKEEKEVNAEVEGGVTEISIMENLEMKKEDSAEEEIETIVRADSRKKKYT